MPNTKNHFVITKIPRDNPLKNIVKNFPSMPIMYLELIENKRKIKEDMLNKTYNPPISSNIEPVLPTIVTHSDNKDIFRDDISVSSKETLRSGKYSRESSRYSRDSSRYSRDSSRYSRGSSRYSRGSSRESDRSRVSNRLLELLDEENGSDEKVAPTLNELRGIKDVQEPDEDEDDMKRELLFKFELLKKSYKGVEIPEHDMDSNYKSLSRDYDNTVRRVTIDSNVESYKTYLIGGFMAVEYGLGYFLKFDMKGFTQQQMVNMNSYDTLLIELGEKSYVPAAKQWSVEVRLLFLIIFNAAVFVISKMILRGTGNNILSMMNNVTNSVVKTPLKKRKMKGPDVVLSDLP